MQKAALASCALLVLVSWRAPQGLAHADPTWQLKAVDQFLRGQSPTFNTLVQPDPRDLSQDDRRWIIWWPPGGPLLVLPWMAAGIPPGITLRLLVIACLVSGALGWTRWFALFDLPPRWQLALACLLPWMRYASSNVFLYSTEALVFGVTGWAPYLAWKLASPHRPTELVQQPPSKTRMLCFGLFLGSFFVLKYSAVVITVGVLAYLAALALRRSGRGPLSAHWILAAGWAFPIVALSIVNLSLGSHANMLSASAGLHWRVENLLHAAVNPPLMLADAEAMAGYLLLDPTRSPFQHPLLKVALGLPGACIAFWLAFRAPPLETPEALARVIFGAAFLCLLLIWTLSPYPSFEARHFASPSIAALPLLLRRGLDRWRGPAARPLVRPILALAAFGYILAPYLYGVATVAGKSIRTYPGELSPSRLYNPWISTLRQAGALRALAAAFDPSGDVWYLPDPIHSLDLPGRAILRGPLFDSVATLKMERFCTSTPLRARVLLPNDFETNQKGPVIRAAFPQARHWTSGAVPHSNYSLWTAELAGPCPPRQ